MKIKCQCGAELEVYKKSAWNNGDVDLYVLPHICMTGKPLEFPPLVTINGEAMDVESVIPFPLEGETRDLFRNRRVSVETRPVLVEVVSRE